MTSYRLIISIIFKWVSCFPKEDFFREFFWKGKKQLNPVNFELYFNMYWTCIKKFFLTGNNKLWQIYQSIP